MKDITIQVVKSDEGYRVVVNDDSITKDNPEGWKCNNYKFDYADKDQVREGVQSILDGLE